MRPSNWLFLAVMIVALGSAFVLPPRAGGNVRLGLAGVFTPVSWPVHRAAEAMGRPPSVVDAESTPRSDESVRAENYALRTELAMLRVKFDDLSRLNADRSAVGTIRSLCEPAKVVGFDGSGVRESLTISATSAVVGRPVIHDHDLIGRVTRSGPAGGEVRLITDPGLAFTAKIGRYVPQPDGSLKLVFAEKIRPLVRGVGHGEMAATGTLSRKDLADAQVVVGDWVLLDDADWPSNVQGATAGRIVSILSQSKAPLTADVRIKPAIDLPKLSEVMVMVRDEIPNPKTQIPMKSQ